MCGEKEILRTQKLYSRNQQLNRGIAIVQIQQFRRFKQNLPEGFGFKEINFMNI